MSDRYSNLLKARLTDGNHDKLMQLQNPALHEFVAKGIEICNPDSVFVCTDAAEDIRYIREQAVATGEEGKLAIEGHTCHFDGYNDQARDKANTKYLVTPGLELGKKILSIPKEEGLAEVTGFLKDSMAGREMLVRFFCLGPADSVFSISGVQMTDSFYVAHSEDLLYRPGYEQFKTIGDSPEFVRVLHSVGETENGVSKNVDERRIYIDVETDTVYSVNTQYGGNTIGFKKLAFRLAIRKADREGWLAEHMFVMGVHGPGGRKTYFTGAFPSFCGKTSTAMVPGESIIGDDLAYLRKIDGEVRSVNVESGIFGIIRNVNAKDDPIIWDVLSSPGEVIISNVLVCDGVPYWLGDTREVPDHGFNHSGKWHDGKSDEMGNEIHLAHKNARFTVALDALANRDERADDPDGVPVGGIIYGGRDSDTSVPVQQSFDWEHGVIMIGASLESETTAATLGRLGVRAFQPMSNLDFIAIPLGKYVRNHLDFISGVERPPIIFGVNYFLKNEGGGYLNSMQDKYVWLKWMERRVHGEMDTIRIPTGYIPKYEDLRKLFREVLEDEYTEAQYSEQFTLRIPENLRKLDRIEYIYTNDIEDAPDVFFRVLAEQRQRLLLAQRRFGDYVEPSKFC